jgi:hypothetical protein
MKMTTFNLSRFLTAASVGAACVAFPLSSQAGPLDFLKKKVDKELDRHDHDHDHDNDRNRNYKKDDHRGHDHNDVRYRSYVAAPRSTFVLTLGSGYAGQGYYYGPPNSSYYYQTPGVVYYRNRDAVPRQYYPRDWQQQQMGSSTDASVQRALARRGYYNGPIDGSLGPGSRNAIARYQRERGLPVTGTVTSSLLRSLGI